MRKDEFLSKLKERLLKDKCQEVDDIINYYEELIEDRMENENEEDVVDSLGSIDDIAVRVNVKSGYRLSNEKIHYDEYEEPAVVERRPKSKKKLVWAIVITAVTSPIWIALIASAIAVTVGLIAGTVSVGFSGIGCVADGALMLVDSVGNGVFEIGIGFVLIGLTVMAVPLLIKLFTFVTKSIIRLVKWLIAKFKEWRDQ